MRLDLRGIEAGYGSTRVLRDVDLTVPEGKVVALLGPNGAGKSTTLNVVSGIVPARKGSVAFDGDDVTELRSTSRVGMGLCHVTEAGAIFPTLSVADNLRLFTPPHDDGSALGRALEAFPRLQERSTQIAGTLSGGEQRMLALARTYAQKPSLVILDEVSLGLAPIVVDAIFDFLGKLAAEGTSLLIVEQYVSRVLAMADLVYVMVRGQIAFAGEPSEILGSQLLEHYFGAEAPARS